MNFAERLKIGCASLVLATALPGMAARPETRSRTIRVVVDKNYAPYSFQPGGGELRGIVIDQWRAWEKKTGIRAEIVGLDWDEALHRMRAGEFDVIDCITATDARRQVFDFTPAYTTIDTSIFFRREIPGITDLVSLRGFPVGAKAGDQNIDRLKEQGVTTVIVFRNYEQIISAAKEHKIDVFVMDLPAARYLLSKNDVANSFRHSRPIFRGQLRRAVRKGDLTTLDVVNRGFAAIEPGEIRRIDQEWFGRSIRTHDLIYAGYVVAAALLLIAGLSGWNYLLRKKVDQRTAALSETEERFRQIAENIREVFWLVSKDSGELLYVSPAYEVVWGRTCLSLYQHSRSFGDAIHPEDRQRVLGIIDGGEGDRGFEVEYRIVRPDGSIRWIWDRGFPIRESTGRVYRLAGIAEDITERKLAGDLLTETEDRNQRIIDSIPVMIWGMRADGVMDFINQRWLDYTGRTVAEALSAPVGSIHPDDAARVILKWQHDQALGVMCEDEMRLRRADGEYKWFLIRTVPVFDEEGTIVGWYGTSVDIEDRKRADENLRQSEAHLAEAQRLAHTGSWDLDIRTGTVTWSDELYRIFGWEPGDPRQREELLAGVPPEDLEILRSSNENAIRTQEPYELIFRVARDGDERILHLRGNVVSDAAGTPVTVSGAIQDVTELRKAENELRSTSEQLRALSDGLRSAREEEGIRIAREIHDELGATLTSLRWELEGIKKASTESSDGVLGRQITEKLSETLEITDTMIAIVRRIASDLRPVVLDVLGLEEAIEWQAIQFQERTGIAVHCASAGGRLELSPAQSTAVFRIFQEALTNILRHARATSVDVAMVEDTGVFVLMIGDNGRGITESQRMGKTSIGLLGMRERADLIGAELDILGVDGEGTTVTLRIPMNVALQ